MFSLSQYLTAEDLKLFGNLEIVARQVVEGFCTGLHRSPHKGFSVEFRQHRAYVPGDEIRHLDWKIFAKSDRFYIREYEEETNLRATIVLDASGSMGYGPAGKTKLDYAKRLAACLSYLMLRQADGVGLVTFDDAIRDHVPSRSRVSHLRAVFDALARTEPGGETDLGRVFHDLVPKLRRRGLLIILSDCFSDLTGLLSALAHLRHARHEILLFPIWDRAELEFPFDQWVRFESLEVAEEFRLVDAAHLKAAYLDNLRRFREELQNGCRRHRIDLQPMVTDQPYATALARCLANRMRSG